MHGPMRENDPRMVTADGVQITDGLIVLDYDYEVTRIDFSNPRSNFESKYWDGWFYCANGSLMNGERVTTRDPQTRRKLTEADIKTSS